MKLTWKYGATPFIADTIFLYDQQGEVVGCINRWGFSPEEQERLANLFCASEEMFAACESALNSLEYIQTAHPGITGSAQRAEARVQLRCAHKKARGEE